MARLIIVILISLVALGFVLYLLFSRKQKPWDQMSTDEQNRKKVLVAGGLTVFIAGIISAIMMTKKK
jgi:Na+/H+ antiporter NhaD/arsenite permease-like protein